MSSGSELPRGTVTFLFTDIEGSTQLLKQLRERYADVLSEHQRIIREAFAEYGGREIDTQGDSFFVAFARAKDAIGAALGAQRALAEQSWPDGAVLRVRMGVHTGEPVLGGDRYVGLGVHRAARISAAGHGGQVLISQTTRELLRDDPQPDVSLRDLGEHQLKDLDEPERIFQLVAPGLATDFPPLKTAAPAPFEGKEVELAAAAQDAVRKLDRAWWADRRVQIAAAVVAVLVVVPVVTVLAGGGGGGSAQASGEVEANSVGVIDPGTGKVASTIPVGEAPGGVAYGDDSVWVANTDANSVSRIDPQSHSVRQTIQVGGGPTGVAVSGDSVWVANGLDGTVSRIDPGSQQVVDTIRVGNGPAGITFGAGAVWVANSVDGTISKLNPESGRVLRTIPAAIGATGVAVGNGYVWVVSPTSATVVVVDPRSGEVADRIGVGGDATAITVGAGGVWVANRAVDTVQKIDPQARAVVATIPVGHGPSALAADANDLWVANSVDTTLSKIDPAREAVVRTVQVVNRPQGIAVTPDGLYVAVRSTGAEHRGGTLRVAAPEGPDSIDPAVSYSPSGWTLLTLTNDGLVAFRRVGGIGGTQLVPDLALSVPTPSADGTSYTFRLRPGIRYSNGRPVEPEDFRRAIERVLSVQHAEGAFLFSGIVGADRCRPGKRCDLSRGIATNTVARTVTFRLQAPDGDFLTKLALPFAVAVPAQTPAKDTGTKPLPATGPYMIASYRTHGRVKLVRNPRFRSWSADARPDGYPDVILWTPSASFEAVQPRVRAVERNAADLARSLVPPMSKNELDVLATRHSSQLRFNPFASTNFFFLNTRVPPFDDIRVRRAVNLAFDRQAFAQLLGRAVAPTCQILPPNFPAYRPTCLYVPTGVAGLDKARRLVRSSGTSGASVTVWVFTPVAIQGRYVVSMLKSLGYRARLKTVPADQPYFEKVLDSRRRVQIAYYGWAFDYPSARNFLEPMFSCSGFVPGVPERTANGSELCNRSIDRQIERAAAAQAHDPALGNVLWQRAERSILELAPMIPTTTRLNVDFVSEHVGNYQYHPQWGALLDQLWVK